jgi:hypothetical protein
MEIDELSRNLENKKESQKATAEKLKEAKKSCEALKKELEGLDAKEYGTKLEVMLICEKAAAAERVAASRQSFKDTSKAKEYQHRKDATMDKVNGLILARRAGVGSTIKILSRTVMEICLTLMESLMMHLCEQSLLALNDDWIVIQMRYIHFILFYCIATY